MDIRLFCRYSLTREVASIVSQIPQRVNYLRDIHKGVLDVEKFKSYLREYCLWHQTQLHNATYASIYRSYTALEPLMLCIKICWLPLLTDTDCTAD